MQLFIFLNCLDRVPTISNPSTMKVAMADSVEARRDCTTAYSRSVKRCAMF